MKPSVGIVLPPASHSQRGIGYYQKHLKSSLSAAASDLNLQFLDSPPKARFDLLHYAYFDLFSHTLPIIKNTKSIVTILDLVPLDFPTHYPPGFRGSLALFLQRLALFSVSEVITISEFSKSQIVKYFRLPPEKISVTYLAASGDFVKITDKKLLSPVKHKYNLPDSFALFLGDINWNKNLNRLTKACVDAGLHLVIAGKNAARSDLNLNHPELLHWKEWLDLYQNHPLVHRLGFVPDSDLPALFNLATAYCQASLAEGFGLPVLQAMACGTPVACTNRSSLPEIAGSAALYFDPEDTTQIKDTLLSLVNNPGLQKDLASKGLVNSARFSWEKTAVQTLEIYQNNL